MMRFVCIVVVVKFSMLQICALQNSFFLVLQGLEIRNTFSGSIGIFKKLNCSIKLCKY